MIPAITFVVLLVGVCYSVDQSSKAPTDWYLFTSFHFISFLTMRPLVYTAQYNYMNQTNRVIINYGTYYYDYSAGSKTQGQMRIEQRQCPEGQFPHFRRVRFALTFTARSKLIPRSCTLYLVNHNVYKYTQDDGVCCLAFPGLGMLH
jgi:hypothetical protein